MKTFTSSLILISLVALNSVQASFYDVYFDSILNAFVKNNEKLIDQLYLDDQLMPVPFKLGLNDSVILNFTSNSLHGLKRIHRSDPIEVSFDENKQRVIQIPLASTNITVQTTVTSTVNTYGGRKLTSLPIGINVTMDKLEYSVTIEKRPLKKGKGEIKIKEMENFQVNFYNPSHKSEILDVFTKIFSNVFNRFLSKQAKNVTEQLLKVALEDKMDIFPYDSIPILRGGDEI